MAKTITINVSDVDEKILYDILKKDESGVEGIQDWTDKAVAGRINHAWKEFKNGTFVAKTENITVSPR